MPIPQVNTLAELNEELAGRCRIDLDRTLRGKSTTKRALLREELAEMLDLPRQAFDARRVTGASANSLSLVPFDTNRYSIPVKYAHRQITIVASVDEVRLTFQGELIARHPRHWGREQHVFDPVHYLALLERKSGGLDHARPLEEWDLPTCFTVLRRRMESDPEELETREYIRTLRLLQSTSVQELAEAIEYALDIGIHDADSIRVILEHRRESPVGLFSLEGRRHLKTVAVAETSFSVYQTLLTKDAL